MSLSSALPPLSNQYSRNEGSGRENKLQDTGSTTSSKKKSKVKADAKAKKEAEEKAAKESEERYLRLYSLWSQVKQGEKDEQLQHLQEKVSMQHELIKRQDELFKLNQKRLEQKRQQVKETKRLVRLTREKKYTNFVKDALAKEKREASKLLSRTRVISSHQPIRIQSYNEEVHRKSEAVSRRHSSGGQSSWHSSEQMDSTLHTDNFRELLHDPLDVQLQKLLGGEDADSFLNPVFREGAKKTMIPLNAQKLNGIGADDLWTNLRSKSRVKLEKEDSLIPLELKSAYRAFLRQCIQNNIPPVHRSFCTGEQNGLEEDPGSESHLIQDIYYARHRLDLMFRVARINRDKTRLLFRNVEPSDAAEGTVRPQQYNPNQIVKRKAKPLPALTCNYPTSIPQEDTCVKDDLHKTPYATVGEQKIKFLTEKMASCEGEFSKRHNAPGASTDRTHSQKRDHIRGTVSAPPSSRGARDMMKSQGRLWEPLSLSALLEYKAPQVVPGSGEFLNGQTKKWEVL